MSLFGQTRDNAEKKKIGSDMTNPNMGHMIRGRFCSALARLLLDGLRPYRLQGIVQDNIWDVTIAFCNAGTSRKEKVHPGLIDYIYCALFVNFSRSDRHAPMAWVNKTTNQSN